MERTGLAFTFEVIINMEKKLMLEIAATDYKQAS